MPIERSGDVDMHRAIDAAMGQFPGRLCVYARNLRSGEEVGRDADAVMPTASVIKVPIMAVLYDRVARGEIDLGQRVVLEAADWRGGTGILKELQPGLEPTIGDLCRVMICLSDNIATRMLVRMLGNEQINATLATWGYASTRTIFEMDPGDDIRSYALSTARDLGRMMTAIAEGMLVSAEANAAMLHHLSRQQHLEQIPRGLPFSPYLEESGRSQAVHVYNKIGCYKGMRADAAYVEAPAGRFVLVTINEGSADEGYGVDHEGNVLNGRIGKIVFDRWATVPGDR